MFEPQASDAVPPAFERDQFEHAKQRALLDLQRIAADLIRRHIKMNRDSGGYVAMSWRALLEIEEQAFSDLGFQGRHDPAVVDALVHLSSSQLPGPNIDDAVDWSVSDQVLPAVYLVARAMVDARS
ncbi:DUF2471 family protein [Burkholderia stagnalis]|uniref:DUF2471 family protein n=1 Tax=Burkholderia stagnalis TaxID=1503054 RepID=UPI000755DE2C|nr:DUF2471 family protein [Burkholderia stagnalis]KWI30982.1 hypothetical protein WT71_12760 [Burkholderia stagnalis]KWI80333.1 hypothetical protein WT73_28695 [Burkholderia stagnalis]